MKNKILPQFFFAEAEAASYEWVKKMWVVWKRLRLNTANCCLTVEKKSSLVWSIFY